MKNVAVLGAAGKMGSGIALLLLQELAKVDGAVLTLLETEEKRFDGLKTYLYDHLKKYAPNEAFVRTAMEKIRYVTSPQECAQSKLIFEAVVEDVNLKADLFRRIDNHATADTYYFTNTSSIPISVLQEKSHLEGRLIGFHFYNPPAVQKLLEIIIPEKCSQELQLQAMEIARRLKKTVVISHDIAGFIGNGYFIREIKNACDHVRKLSASMPYFQAISTVNSITQNLLLRPMGIFQLIDYVGIDVCWHISQIMTTYLFTNFTDPLIKEMWKRKENFFRYEKGKPIAVYDAGSQCYVDYLPASTAYALPWKELSKDPDRQKKIVLYLEQLDRDHSQEAELAKTLLAESDFIIQGLVKDRVADSVKDVQTVLQNGFFHLF